MVLVSSFVLKENINS